MTVYIDEHRDEFGVEPVCEALQVAPSTYYAAKRRAPSAGGLDNARLKAAIVRLHEDSLGVYGMRKMWRAAPARGHRRRA